MLSIYFCINILIIFVGDYSLKLNPFFVHLMQITHTHHYGKMNKSNTYKIRHREVFNFICKKKQKNKAKLS